MITFYKSIDVMWFKNFSVADYVSIGFGFLAVFSFFTWLYFYRKAFDKYKEQESLHFAYSDRVYSFVAEKGSYIYNLTDPFYFSCWGDFYSSKACLLTSYLELRRLAPFLPRSCPTKWGPSFRSELVSARLVDLYAREGQRYYEISFYISEIGFEGETLKFDFIDQYVYDMMPLKITSKGDPVALFFSEQRNTQDVFNTVYHGDSGLLRYRIHDAALHELYISLKRKLFASYVALGNDRIYQEPVLVDVSNVPYRQLDKPGKLRRDLLDAQRQFEDLEKQTRRSRSLGTSEPMLFEDIRIPAPTPLQPRSITSKFPGLNSSKLLFEQLMIEFSSSISVRGERLNKICDAYLSRWNRSSFESRESARSAIVSLLDYNEEQVSFNKLVLRQLSYRSRYAPTSADEGLRLKALEDLKNSSRILALNRENARPRFDMLESDTARDSDLDGIERDFVDFDGHELKLCSSIEEPECLRQAGQFVSEFEGSNALDSSKGLLRVLKGFIEILKELF